MPKFVIWGSYCENVLEKRAPYRQAHLEGLNHIWTEYQVKEWIQAI